MKTATQVESPSTSALTVKVFADSGELRVLRLLGGHPLVKGFTTNPTLMRRAGVTDYRAFAEQAVREAAGRPISFAILADDLDAMEDQAHEIASWGENV